LGLDGRLRHPCPVLRGGRGRAPGGAGDLLQREHLRRALLITDLFIEDGFTEQGSYSLDGGASWTDFFADGLHSNGEVELALGAGIDGILFTAPGIVGDENHEFSVGGFDAGVHPMPEPSAALMFAVGFLVVGRAVRSTRR
jgi:hypothetical protein